MSEVFGKYQLMHRIGVGGMAEVFVAKTFGPEGFVKDVVIKRILPAFNEDPNFIKMFINEARLAARLQHANIVQIFDFNHVEEIYYIAMEFVDGKDLKRIFDLSQKKGHPIPYQMAIHICVEVLKGLHYAHALSEDGTPLHVVHRDISPQNILVSRSGEVRITDFGIAKVAAFASATKDGMIKGKLAYMSPEQAGGLPLDCRSDLFSLGIILWELLTNRQLYQAESASELYAKVKQAQIVPPSSLIEDIPKDLEQIVLRLLAPAVEDRYSNAAEVLKALSAFATVRDSLTVSSYMCELIDADPPKGERTEDLSKKDMEKKSSAFQMERGDSEGKDLAPSKTLERSLTLLPSRRLSRLPMLVAFVILGGVGWLLAPLSSNSIEPHKFVVVSIDSKPSNADILLNGVFLGKSPQIIESPVGKLFQIEAQKGSLRASRAYRVSSADSIKLHLAKPSNLKKHRISEPEITKKPSEKQPSVPVVDTRTTGKEPQVTTEKESKEPKHLKKLTRKSLRKDKKAKESRAKTSPFMKGKGIHDSSFIEIKVLPWAKVEIDGKDVGQTPLIKYPLSVGRHRIVIGNSAMKRREILNVKIESGKKFVIRRNWEKRK